MLSIDEDGDLPGFKAVRVSGLYRLRDGARRHQGPAHRDLPARLRGDRGRRTHPGALRPGLQRRPGADPVAAAHRGGAPAPGPGADPHPGRADRRVRRLPRGAPRRRADRLRRRGGQPVPGLRVGRGPDRHRRAGRASTPRAGDPQLRQGARQGRPEDHVEDGHLDRLVVLRRAGLRGGRPGHPAGAALLRAAPRARSAASGWPRSTPRWPPGTRVAYPAERAAERSAPAAGRRRRVPVAPRGRAAPVQPGDGLPAPARHPQPAVRRVPAVHRQGRRAGRPGAARCAGCSRCAPGSARRCRWTRSSRPARSSSGSPPAPCRTARSRPRRTRPWPSR